MDKIIAAIIGLIGVVLGALFKTFEDELKSIFLGRTKHNRDLIGKWKCTWFEGEKRLPSDIVVISKISGERIVANGENPKYGSYKLTGRISPSNVITLIYQAEQSKPYYALGGVVILKLKDGRNEMEGYWNEYAADSQFYGGTTAWKKI